MPTVNVWAAVFARHFVDAHEDNLRAIWQQFDYVHNRCPTDAEIETLNAQARQMTAVEARREADIAVLALTETETT